MRSLSSLGLALAIGVFTLVSSGCNLAELRDSNRRLKEANERLIVQKNQLEQELALHQQSTGSKDAEIARLRSQLDSVLRTPVATTPERIPAPAPDEFRDLGLESGQTAQGTWVRLDSAVFFALGKASLSGQGKSQLNRLVGILESRYGANRIRVEGHTDDIPVKKVKHVYPTNWELSSARACSVVRYLVDKGGSPHRIYPAGFSKYRPRLQGTSSSARKKNRRVEILILNDGQI